MGLGGTSYSGAYVRRPPRRSIAAAVAAVAALSLVAVPPALAKGRPDFGDAPDGAKAGYPSKPKVVGHFPSKASSGGPRHATRGALKLGPTNTGEGKSRQVDRDRDDGASLTVGKPCQTATLTAALRGSKRAARGDFVYVNAWFDWNRDGDWADPSDGCAAEWAVRNLPVRASSVRGIRMLPIKLRAGKQVKELWYRVTVTLDEVQVDTAGRGRTVPYRFGETEDYLHLSPGGIWLGPPVEEGEKEREEREEREEEKAGKFSVRCFPFLRVIPHGGRTTFAFLIKQGKRAKGSIFGRFPGGRKGKGYKVKLVRARNQGGVPPGYVRARAFVFTSSDIDPPTRMQLVTIGVVFTRGKFVRRVNCRVLIFHKGKARHKKGKGKKHELPPKVKPVRCKEACAGKSKQPPPGVTLTEYTPQPGDTFRLRFNSSRPLEGFTLPLDERNPPTRDPPSVGGLNGPVKCELKPLTLSGGPAALECDPFPPFQVDSFFDVVYRIEFVGAPPTFSGTIDDSVGNPIEGFEARPAIPVQLPPPPPPPPVPNVNGTGTLMPNPNNPQAVDFKATFDFANTTLGQFVIQVPPGLQVASGDAEGFTCSPIDFEGAFRALVCNGPVTTGAEIQGGFELTQPRPDQLAAQSTLFAAETPLTAKFGPFGLGQNPGSPNGGGDTAPGSTVGFNVQFDTFGALDSFALDLTNDALQIQSGDAENLAGSFECNPAPDGEANPANALVCTGKPIVNGQQIMGSYTLAVPTTSIGADLFGKGPSTGSLGPFTLTTGP